jgi:hypothetical protein
MAAREAKSLLRRGDQTGQFRDIRRDGGSFSNERSAVATAGKGQVLVGVAGFEPATPSSRTGSGPAEFASAFASELLSTG